MLANYVKVSYRNLIKYKSFSLINILGLSIGIGSIIFIEMYVINEMNYDRYNFDADRIYRVCVRGNITGNYINQAVTAAPMAEAILKENNKILHVTRIGRFGDWLVRYQDKKFNEKRFLFADSSFFSVFSIPLIKGDPKQALTLPYTVVITEETAKRYFGNLNPIGRLLRLETDSVYYEVTGVVKIPFNTHFQFDFLASLSTFRQINRQGWLSHSFYTYLKVEKNYTKEELTNDLNKLISKYVIPEYERITLKPSGSFFKEGNQFEYFVQPLTSIHMHSNLQFELSTNADSKYVYIYIFIGILLLIIASINFMNLSTARAANRAKEVGLRKAIGSEQGQLLSQFLIESIFLGFIALLIALVFVEVFTPAYQNLIHQKLTLVMFFHPLFIIGLIFLAILVGLLAGSYPAFILTSFKPVKTLKGDLKSSRQSPLLRNILVVTQFAASVFIILCTFVVYRQLSYMTNHDLGFSQEQVLVINRSEGLKDKIEPFKKVLVQNQNIIGVANSTHVPGKVFLVNAFFLKEKPNTPFLLNQAIVSPEIVKVLKLKLHEGRFFSASIPGDTFACVLNRTAVKVLDLKKTLGSVINFTNDGRVAFNVIGVVEDFNFKSLHYPIEPLIMTFMRKNIDGYVTVRINTANVDKTLDYIHKTWDSFTKDYPFDYFWLNEDFNKLYSSERLTANVFSSFSLLSILIACLGLFGLIAYTSAQRTREIGIRKTFGATFGSIVLMLTKDIVRLVIISLFISWPAAYLLTRKWLEGFTYHINVPYQDFLYSAFIAFVIALATISSQAIKAARKNPADALRHE
jgi:putative ABC transport system permease protein